MVTVYNFSDGFLNPILGYAVSCLGAFLGLCCITRANYYRQTRSRIRWLAAGAAAIGATGVWAMHFIAMLGFSIPSQRITYNVPVTIAALPIVATIVGVGVFVVGFGNGSLRRLLVGGVFVGLGIATMHYMGMAAMVMNDSMTYSKPLLILSVLIAVVAGTTALWIGTWFRGIGATLGASLVLGAAVSGMHYTGMAAMRFHPGMMTAMQGASQGASAESFLLPLVLGITLATFVLAVIVSLSPTEDELRDDADFRTRLELLERSHRYTRAFSAGTRPVREDMRSR